MKIKYLLSAIVLISLLFVSGVASARPLNAALGTGFTYQGKLTDGGAPANGTYDFEFKLYNALSGGGQAGSTVPLGDVAVTDGLFTVQLDFGNVFDGTALFLEIGVRPGASAGAYTPLTPRQALTATPYAIYAAKAPWSGLTGMPAGFADGTDDGITYTAGTGLSLVGTQFNVTGAPWSGLTGVPAGFADGVDNGASYQNVVIVAKSGGDFTTITAALNSITTASTTNRYLIYVAPGVYNEQVTMKQYVDIEGAGELTTKITYTGSAALDTGTVAGANDAELRFLTVENTGGADYATAIYNSSTSPRLTHVTASASGGTDSSGVFNDSSSPTMTDVSASASGGTVSNYGVYNYSSSSPTMTNVSASASGGTENYGVYNDSSSPTMTDVSASASGGSYNYGVYNYFSSPTMTDVSASASGGTDSNYGVYNYYYSSPTMTDVSASASGGSDNYGVYNDFSSPTMTDVSASASGGLYNSFGVFNDSSSPTMTNVSASASGGTNNYGVYNSDSSSPTMTDVSASASGGTNSYGVYNSSSSSPTMTDVSASASGGTENNYGVYNYSSSPTMTNVSASASGGTNGNYGMFNVYSSPTINNSVISASGGTNNYGIYNYAGGGSYTVLVNNSQISGGSNTIYNNPYFTTRIGASQLSGGAVAGGGTVTCAGVYDASYTFYATTCP